MNIKIVFTTLAIIFVVVLGLFALSKVGGGYTESTGELITFANCIKDSGAKFYGASWCSHCQNQKAVFGEAARYLPYIECATPDNEGQVQECTDAEITSYPTWVFSDGSHLPGERSFAVLAEKTGCASPLATTTDSVTE